MYYSLESLHIKVNLDVLISPAWSSQSGDQVISRWDPALSALLLCILLLLSNTVTCWYSWLLWLFLMMFMVETAQTLNLVNYVYEGVIVESLWSNKTGDCVGFSGVDAGLS